MSTLVIAPALSRNFQPFPDPICFHPEAGNETVTVSAVSPAEL